MNLPIYSLDSPDLELFLQDGMEPLSALTIGHPEPSEMARAGLDSVMSGILKYMDAEQYSHLPRTELEFESGRVLPIQPDSLVVVLSYEDGCSKILNFQLLDMQPDSGTVH